MMINNGRYECPNNCEYLDENSECTASECQHETQHRMDRDTIADMKYHERIDDKGESQ